MACWWLWAADVPDAQAATLAATPRPITLSALREASRFATSRMLPTYMINGTADRNIPAAVMKFMSERAHARKAAVLNGAFDALMVSHPTEVTALIEDAAQAE